MSKMQARIGRKLGMGLSAFKKVHRDVDNRDKTYDQ